MSRLEGSSPPRFRGARIASGHLRRPARLSRTSAPGLVKIVGTDTTRRPPEFGTTRAPGFGTSFALGNHAAVVPDRYALVEGQPGVVDAKASSQEATPDLG